jgi:hypothetical protein
MFKRATSKANRAALCFWLAETKCFVVDCGNPLLHDI